ncbi:DUF6172 family protein [Actomonas aquatica]|uniref:DUF6172 family protein n=1 Tax=Actomonas aquatica TaxID=2866162 RepID=A0ABZ1C861_9BACT|nr:DUF6172 family protein [Opitutus sp. WL0086]WRQ87458.1 DUF6172 family protein [Opitutus sp. WL0086]
MKKTFKLTDPRLAAARVRDKIRHEVNKYVKRERRKELPEGHDRWEFNCRLGVTEATAEPLPLGDVPAAIDRLGEQDGAETVFIEVLAKARPGRAAKADA